MLARSRQVRFDPAIVRWLLVALLAWSQLAVAAHQFEHDITETGGEFCDLCVKLDRTDDALADAESARPAAGGATRGLVDAVGFEPAHHRAHFRARASP